MNSLRVHIKRCLLLFLSLGYVVRFCVLRRWRRIACVVGAPGIGALPFIVVRVIAFLAIAAELHVSCLLIRPLIIYVFAIDQLVNAPALVVPGQLHWLVAPDVRVRRRVRTASVLHAHQLINPII